MWLITSIYFHLLDRVICRWKSDDVRSTKTDPCFVKMEDDITEDYNVCMDNGLGPGCPFDGFLIGSSS